MASFRARKGATEVFANLDDLRNRLLPCLWKDEGIVLNMEDSSERSEAVSLLISLGFGKGTLSRNAPDFIERDMEGLEGATGDRPFAVPRRLRLQRPTDTSNDDLKTITSSPQSSLLEEFQFSSEEALYLVENLEAISVTAETDGKCLNARQMLKRINRLQTQFEARYFVYKYYRKQGWVVKLGTKVGVDLLLYPSGGPLMAHAQYGVCIHHTHELPEKAWTAPWTVASRVLDSVAKHLLIAILERSETLENTSQFTLKELVLARWQSTNISKAN